MIHRLWFRFVILSAAIPIVAILAVAFFASRATARQFDDVVTENLTPFVQGFTVASVAGGYPPDAGALQAIGEMPVTETATICGSGAGKGVFTARLSADGALSAPDDRIATTLVGGASPSGALMGEDGSRFLVYGSVPFAAVYSDDRRGFLDGVNRDLLLGAAVAGVVSTTFATVGARRMLRPVSALTTAARRLERGDLATRVDARSRDELGELAHAFNSMAESLERSESLRRSMTSDIAHELRTPLHALSGYLDAVADGVAEPDEALFRVLHEETGVLIRLVGDLDDLARAEAGQLRLDRRETDAGAIATRCVEVARPRAEEHGLRIAADVAPGLPAISADPGRVAQVVRNLVDNAITHTPEGGAVTVAVTPEPGGGVVVTVSDTGEGIAPEHLPFLFERFYRADASRTRRTGGAGLGLAIVRQLVEAHGGTVAVESTPGAGSRFTVQFPGTAPEA